MSASESEDGWKAVPPPTLLDFDPTGPYIRNVGMFAYNWLNSWFSRLDRHFAPPVETLVTVKFQCYEASPKKDLERNVVFRYPGADEPGEIIYKMRAGDWMHGPPSSRGEDLLAGRWDLAIGTMPDLNTFSSTDEVEMRVYNWPGDLITIHARDFDYIERYTQNQVLSTHTAIDCLSRIQASQLVMRPIDEVEDSHELYRWADIGEFEPF
ncbi:hypothetical protein CC86DRAFT_411848 [Ophiobolus disseminans]|uniref:Uncharacterized protein n=1 Tax=Ophiobolus disseminans TaxID=1469910 RepID=A0A6A6ZI44_9PLEO|nr:hypothetical protein CC86DRAFT_411848 [Ophiobolus disseminans]